MIIKTDDNFDGVVLKSLPPTPGFIASHIIEGEYPDNDGDKSHLVLSRATADKLSLSPGDRVFTYFFIDDNIKARRLTVTGIYDTHFTEFDSHLAFCDIGFLQTLDHVDAESGSMIEINGIDGDNDIEHRAFLLQDTIIKKAAADGGHIMDVTNIHRTGALYFNWLSLLDTNVTVILILMALVAGFTLVSSTFIIILERVKMIGILKTMGMSNNSIRHIFIYMGEKLVVRGLIIGNVIGIGLLLIQKYFELLPLDPEAYYLDYVR